MKRLLLAFLLATGTTAVEVVAVDYYRSNALGMELERIDSTRIGRYSFVLEVRTDQNTETRIVTRDGNEYRRWVTVSGTDGAFTERYFENGVIKSEITFIDRTISAETLYADGEVDERREYLYERGLLSGLTVKGPNDVVIVSMTYHRAADGRLRRIVRHVQEERAVDSYGFADGVLYQEWHGTSGEGALTRYSQRKAVSEEKWDGQDLSRIESTDRGVDSVTRTVVVPGDETRIERVFDRQDQLLSERTDTAGMNVEVVDHVYDANDRLKKTVRVTEGVREVWEYQYGRDEYERTVRYSVNDSIVKVTHHTGEDSYHEDIYRNGEAVLRVFFVDGVKERETYLGSARQEQ